MHRLDRNSQGYGLKKAKSVAVNAQELTISVVIPVWNRADLLLRALGSVRAQILQPTEIIVVDDGSDPPIRTALDASALDGVTVLRSDTNKGAAAARNIGIATARGSYIAFLDSDDIWHPEKLTAQLAYMRAIGSMVCCTGFWWHRLSGQGRAELRLPEGSVDERRLVWGVDLSPGSTLMARAEALRAIGPQDERLRRLEDWDWLLRAAYQYRIDVLDRPLATIEEGALTVIDAKGQPLATFDESFLMADPVSVRQHAMRVLRLHTWRLAKRSPLNVMRLASTVLLETAAANYRAKKIPTAMLYGLASVIAWPLRNRHFFERVAAKLLPSRADAVKPSRAQRVVHLISGVGDDGIYRALSNLVLRKHQDGQQECDQLIVALNRTGAEASSIDRLGIEFLAIGSSPSGLIRTSMRVAHSLRERRPDVVNCWGYRANLVGALATLIYRQKRLVRLYWNIRPGDMDSRQDIRSWARARRLGAWLSSLPDLIILSSFRGTRMHVGLGYNASQIVVFDDGVDTDRFRPDDNYRRRSRQELGLPADAFVIGVLARIEPVKGYDILRAALRHCPGVRCVMVGSGTEKLPHSEQVLGVGQRNDIEELLPAFDACVTSLGFGEGSPNDIMEAMAVGLPVIATDIGDSARIVGDAGIVVPSGDTEALAEAIRTLQHDRDRRLALGIAARRRAVEHFALDICAARYERLLLDGVADTSVA